MIARQDFHADKFLDVLNSQNPQIQYTIEKENEQNKFNFLDVTIKNRGTGKYEFDVHRKNAITNVTIKPNSYVDPKHVTSIFKGFVHRALRICSPEYLEDEINFLLEMLKENGHDVKPLQEIVKTIKSNDKEQNKENKEEESTRIAKLPWVPVIGPKIRRELKQMGYKVIFTSGRNLKNLLCNNKSKLTPNSNPGVYQLDCSCGGRYIGETKKRVLIRSLEHQYDSMVGKWSSSGVTEHSKNCHGQFNWLHPKTICAISNYRERKIRESLEINNLETIAENNTTLKMLNRDRGNIVDTNSWKPLFQKLNQKRRNSMLSFDVSQDVK